MCCVHCREDVVVARAQVGCHVRDPMPNLRFAEQLPIEAMEDAPNRLMELRIGWPVGQLTDGSRNAPLTANVDERRKGSQCLRDRVDHPSAARNELQELR